MDSKILFLVLKVLWIGFGIVRYFQIRKREKALIEEVQNCKQRLDNLENAEKTKKLDS
ncbi:MAG: hypothetical protein K1X72_24020 [Pyrinomonadaceae bacterium]|nr:hypothetical protein [Pyrinomonadaceae bacterium]